jgi:hypothetical protein
MCVAFFSRLPLRTAGFFLVGIVIALGWFQREQEDPLQGIISSLEVPLCQRMVPARDVYALTDYGRPVVLYRAIDTNAYLFTVREKEAQETRELRFSLIGVAPPDETSNCFGWVFTAGAYWIYQPDVEHILEDNDYTPIAVPQLDDLIIYRDDSGEIAHCGIVRAAGKDGLILIESKWGQLGRYIHKPQDEIYGNHSTYYHTSRTSHALTIHVGASRSESEQRAEEDTQR